MQRWIGKVAIVTGASSGMGAAIAQKLVEAGVIVVGLARRVERIEENAKKLSDKSGKLHAVKADMTNEDDIVKAIKWTSEKLGPIHILVNNAGLSINKSLLDGETSEWRRCFDTNVIGLCIATREATRNMIENKIDGHVVHINSVAGHKVFNMSVYSASKFAVTNLTEVLRQELNAAKTKIKISSVSPGIVKTEFTDKLDMKGWVDTMPALNPEDIADAVMYVIGTPPHVQVHELIVKPVNEVF